MLFIYSFISCNSQKSFGTDLLILEKEIPMKDVKGRIDHMAFNLEKQILYVAALGNNSVEVVDIKAASVIHSIKNLDEPQGLAFIPETNEVVVANGGNGDCIFYNAGDYSETARLHLSGDADNIRYDQLSGKIYIGYGNGGIAEIGMIDHKLLRTVKLNAHPESFQLDKKNDRIFVNLPDVESIAVIQLSDLKPLDTWKIKNERSNFPMTLDTSTNTVFVGYRNPSIVIGYDAKSGKELSRFDIVDDIDDIFFDSQHKQIVLSGGGGSINLFKANDSGYRQIANIPTRNGARTSFLIPSLRMFILVERSGSGKPAAIGVYKIKD
jgi:DNA-binding beta-propeller fold protein YncE